MQFIILIVLLLINKKITFFNIIAYLLFLHCIQLFHYCCWVCQKLVCFLENYLKGYNNLQISHDLFAKYYFL